MRPPGGIGRGRTALRRRRERALGEVADQDLADLACERITAAITRALPKSLRETAYALACDIAAADGRVSDEEGRLLDLFRQRLGLDQLTAAAIERAARARWAAAK